MSILEPAPPPPSEWAVTRWSLVADLSQRGTPTWESSWTELVEGYRPAMERYVRRVLRRSGSNADPADVVQEFLAVCLEKDWLSRADPDRGRFRAYIQVLLKRYTYRVLKRDRAQRRNPPPGQVVQSLLPDEAEAPLSEEEQADLDDFSRSWVEIAVERAMDRLAAENPRYLLVIQDLIDTEGTGSPELAEKVGLRRQQLAVLRHRARKRFSALFATELAATVDDQECLEVEWKAIQPFLPPGV